MGEVNVVESSYYHKIAKVLDMVSDVCDISRDQIKGRYRGREVVNARRIYAVLCRLHLGLSLQLIGKFIKKDHASILYYTNDHTSLLKYDSVYRDKYNSAERILLANFCNITETSSFLDLLIAENLELKMKLGTLEDRIKKLEDEYSNDNIDSNI